MIHSRWLAALVLVSLSSTVLAQTGGSQVRIACHDDAQKLCANVERGGGRVVNCLISQKDKLSEACRRAMEARTQ